MTEHRINRWQNQFDSDKRVLKDNAAKKVLLSMQPLVGMQIKNIAPLIIF